MTKILLLSHSKSMLNSLRERLNFENIATTEAESLPRATELCSTGHFDAAIVDGEFSSEEMGLPTIVVTRTPDIESAVAALRHGALDYLTPPFDMNRLLETLRSLTANDEETTTLPQRRNSRCHTKEIGRAHV